MESTRPLTNLQLQLLKTFSYELEDSQLEEIRKMLTHYFAEKISDEMDRIFEERGWDDSKLNEWSQEHMRTPYRKNSP